MLCSLTSKELPSVNNSMTRNDSTHPDGVGNEDEYWTVDPSCDKETFP